MNLRVLVISLSCCLALAACGDEEKQKPEPAAKEAPAEMPAPTEKAASESPPGFPTIGEEHTPEGELHEAPPIPSEAGQ